MTKGGSLRQLSDSMRQTYRTVASTGLFAGVYDNINWVSKISEQVVGRTDSLESGTCATIWPLWKARLEHLQLKEFERAFVDAAPLEITDILHTTDEAHLFEQCLIHTILRIIVTYGPEELQKFKDELDKAQPKSDTIIEVHKTPIHPVTAFNIDEATIVGNAEFAEEFYSELNVTKQALFNTWVKLLGGDQLSIARLRALLNIRIGHEGGFSSFGWGAWMPGLFHGKIADAHGFLVTHWGKPNCGARNPGSLWFHNTTLHRLPIVLTSLPTFRICRDLTFVSLYSRVLHCLLRVSGMKSLTQYVTEIKSFGQLEQHATQIYTEFADSKKVDELRWQRRQSNAVPPIAGDMVFENAILFLRDALITREFADAVKAGDSGRMLLVLKIWALGFRGNGRTKYAYEMLHIIHNLTHVWPKELAYNWVVNPTGRFNCFIEIDLMQEHNNFWIKTFYKAHGSGASWEWLEMISPCVTVLRQLSNTMQDLLGSYQGTTHKPADLRDDIKLLMTSLQEHNVYEVQSGRILDDDDPPVKDMTSIGLQALTDSSTNPLDEYNSDFRRLQIRRQRVTPIVGPGSGNHPLANQGSAPLSDSPILASANLASPPGSDSEESEEEEGEFERIMAEDDDPTLRRENAEDVSLDMDDEDCGEADDSDSDSDED
ncbi:hypothetical protein C8J56DRAFT_780827 [Mycena floridula]|nr:hypothetical protein C8J56DRAFT_780827 [Mycena floridula]